MKQIVTKAVYENGVLKPEAPLALAEGERVSVTIISGTSRAAQSYGLLGWTGDPAVVEYFALSPDLDPAERP
ncbi:MAG: antitoxin family protein [Gemmataceae bacterium]|nr:antitoxin family protein [Gemmataceae bacterium]